MWCSTDDSLILAAAATEILFLNCMKLTYSIHWGKADQYYWHQDYLQASMIHLRQLTKRPFGLQLPCNYLTNILLLLWVHSTAGNPAAMFAVILPSCALHSWPFIVLTPQWLLLCELGEHYFDNLMTSSTICHKIFLTYLQLTDQSHQSHLLGQSSNSHSFNSSLSFFF